MIAIGLCRECNTAYSDNDEITISQFRNVRDSQHDENAPVKKRSNSTFAHVAVETFHKVEERKRAAGVAKK